jgi:phytoene dehydrogenase-like protein
MSRVVVVGAGLTGLTACLELERLGHRVTLLEASDRIGGKLRTEITSGFRLDVGFQVYFPGYETASAYLDHDSLDLQYWPNGARVWHQGKWCTIDAAKPIATGMSPLFGLADKLRTLRLKAFAKNLTDRERRSFDDVSAARFLDDFGFSTEYVDRFARPFFGGIFLDRSLSVSAAQFLFVWKSVSIAGAAVPREGMEAIPKQIAKRLRSTRIHTQSSVRGFAKGELHLVGGDRIESDAYVFATGFDAPEWLIPNAKKREALPSKCFHFRLDRCLETKGYLCLNSHPESIVNEVAPVSEVSAGTAPNGGFVVSVTTLETSATEDEIRKELNQKFKPQEGTCLDLIRVDCIQRAQVTQRPGFLSRRPRYETIHPQAFWASDVHTNSSIDGAMSAGIAVARRVSEFLSSRAQVL